MRDEERKSGGFQVSRRGFLKASAAATAAGGGVLDFAVRTSTAEAATVAATYHTTCPYCSAACGQLVDVDTSGNVLDVYGDKDSPINTGGLCSKGAGAYQLVTNPRRLGVPEHTAAVDGRDFTGRAWKRIGNGAWQEMALDSAMTEIAAGDGINHEGLVGIRNQSSGWDTTTPINNVGRNATTVQFFGSSHVNNEQNYLYRKLIADFGTSRVEHQARI